MRGERGLPSWHQQDRGNHTPLSHSVWHLEATPPGVTEGPRPVHPMRRAGPRQEPQGHTRHLETPHAGGPVHPHALLREGPNTTAPANTRHVRGGEQGQAPPPFLRQLGQDGRAPAVGQKPARALPPGRTRATPPSTRRGGGAPYHPRPAGPSPQAHTREEHLQRRPTGTPGTGTTPPLGLGHLRHNLERSRGTARGRARRIRAPQQREGPSPPRRGTEPT